MVIIGFNGNYNGVCWYEMDSIQGHNHGIDIGGVQM